MSGLVLAFSILALYLCLACGIAAWLLTIVLPLWGINVSFYTLFLSIFAVSIIMRLLP